MIFAKENKYLNKELEDDMQKYKRIMEAKGIKSNYNQLLRLDNALISCHKNFEDVKIDDCKDFEDVIDTVIYGGIA